MSREQKEAREGILSISGECRSREKPRSGAKARGGNVLVTLRNKKETSMLGGVGKPEPLPKGARSQKALEAAARTQAFTQSELDDTQRNISEGLAFLRPRWQLWGQ